LSEQAYPAEWVDLGRRGFEETLELQRRLCQRRMEDAIPDLLLLVEHPEVYTVGRRQHVESRLDPSLPIVEIERGGGVTYHGPGQLVGYPILHLREGERDLHRYLRQLEEALIALCGDVGLEGGRRPGLTGVWIGEHKVASIGIAVRRWVTFHGFALNVTTDLTRFAAIHPCGLDASVMTSLSAAGGHLDRVDDLKDRLLTHIGEALRREFRHASAEVLQESRE
jgi:lipoyl(octanoyl) transferase